MTQLGLIYQDLGYYSCARWWYEEAAVYKGNNAKAKNLLGNLFMEGKEVKKNLAEGIRFYRQAAKQGHAAACNNLGMCYEMGLGGIEKDIFKAVELYDQAAAGGSYVGMSNLGYLLACYALQSLSLVSISTSGGAVSSTFGSGGANQVRSKRNKVASYDDLKSEINVQLQKAANLLRREADAGVQDASYQLGRLYSQGFGLPLDPVASFDNFKVASDFGHVDASMCCADMMYSGTGCLKDPSAAAELYKYVAHIGSNASAMNAMGIMYEEGIGVEQNWKTAQHWYLKGAEARELKAAADSFFFMTRMLHEESSI